MNIHIQWKEKMNFDASTGKHQFKMDTKSPLGDDLAPTPKQYLVAAICGCTAMDVVALLKKYKQPLESLAIEADAEIREKPYPQIFTRLHLKFLFAGEMDAAKVMESIQASQTKFCAVSAMVSKVVPISYTAILNGNEIGSGQANFDL